MKFRESTDGSSSYIEAQCYSTEINNSSRVILSLARLAWLERNSSASAATHPSLCHSIGSDPARCQHYQKVKIIYYEVSVDGGVAVVRIHQQCPA
jgi:hypothetical protein